MDECEYIERGRPAPAVEVRAVSDVHIELPTGGYLSFGRGRVASINAFHAALLKWFGVVDLVDPAEQHLLDDAVRNRMESVRLRSLVRSHQSA